MTQRGMAVLGLVFGVALVVSNAAVVALLLEARKPQVELTHDMGSLAKCFANQGGVECTATNALSRPITGCLRGYVMKKVGGEGLAVESQLICSGPIEPHQTIQFQGRWAKGEPIDLCSKESEYTGKQLDWDQCVFDVKSVTP